MSSPCTLHDGLLRLLQLAGDCLVCHRERAVEEEAATTSVFSRIAVLERERCFLISYADLYAGAL